MHDCDPRVAAEFIAPGGELRHLCQSIDRHLDIAAVILGHGGAGRRCKNPRSRRNLSVPGAKGGHAASSARRFQSLIGMSVEFLQRNAFSAGEFGAGFVEITLSPRQIARIDWRHEVRDGKADRFFNGCEPAGRNLGVKSPLLIGRQRNRHLSILGLSANCASSSLLRRLLL
jgi:hypothetical protein